LHLLTFPGAPSFASSPPPPPTPTAIFGRFDLLHNLIFAYL
jgi:hypothetical protein